MAFASYSRKRIEVFLFSFALVRVIIPPEDFEAFATLAADTRMLFSNVVGACVPCLERYHSINQ